MRSLALALLFVAAFAPVARAACPSQPASVDLTDGSGRVCVASTAANPTTSIELRFTQLGVGPVVIPIAPPTGESIFPDGTTVSFSVPASVRGTAPVDAVAIGPGGTATTDVASVTFPAHGVPAAPVVLP